MVWLIVVMFPVFVAAQKNLEPLAFVRSAFTAYSLDRADVAGCSSNQASIVKLSADEAGVYSERRFMLNELLLVQARLAKSAFDGVVAFGVTRFGNNDFAETNWELVYARQLMRELGVGIQFNYYVQRVRGYGKLASIGAELAMMLRVTDQFMLGVQCRNPVTGKLGKNSGEQLQRSIRVGCGYEPSGKVLIAMEITRPELEALNVKAGILYNLWKAVDAAIGFQSSISSLCVGASMQFRKFRFHLSVSSHPQLGITPGTLFIFGNTKKGLE